MTFNKQVITNIFHFVKKLFNQIRLFLNGKALYPLPIIRLGLTFGQLTKSHWINFDHIFLKFLEGNPTLAQLLLQNYSCNH